MSGPDQDYDATYAYDTKGRLNQVLGQGVDTTNGVRYERFSDGDVVQYVRYKDSNNANVLTTERYLESDRDITILSQPFRRAHSTTREEGVRRVAESRTVI